MFTMEKLTGLFAVASHADTAGVVPFVRPEPSLKGLTTKLDEFLVFLAQETAAYGVSAVPSTNPFWRGSRMHSGLSASSCGMTYTCGFELKRNATLSTFGLTAVEEDIVAGGLFPEHNFERDARCDPDAMLRMVFETLADEKIAGVIAQPIRMAFPKLIPDKKPAFACR